MPFVRFADDARRSSKLTVAAYFFVITSYLRTSLRVRPRSGYLLPPTSAEALLADEFRFVHSHKRVPGAVHEACDGAHACVQGVVGDVCDEVGEGARSLHGLSACAWHLVDDLGLGFLIGFYYCPWDSLLCKLVMINE